ncbi:MAG TPA: DUF1761 domain-containing protein [Clostridia bacterium]|nr:DUF1761 domain-containing protein [Clostridia bacterium]
MSARINWLAVVVAAIVHFVLGAVWFTLFAKPWIAGLGLTPEQVQAFAQEMSAGPYVVAFVCNLVMAYAIAWLLVQLGDINALRGIAVGAVLGIFAAVALATEHGFEMRPTSFKLIASGYPLVGSILMGAVIGAWKKKAAVVVGGAGTR